MKTIRYGLLLIILVIITGNASAIGMSNTVFKEAWPGKTYDSSVTLFNSQYDFDNHFVVEISDNLKDWITASPAEFNLSAGNNMEINLTLNVPKDAAPRDIKGTITATGRNYAPDNNNGGGSKLSYMIAARGNILVSVVNPGAVAEVEIVNIDVPERVPTKDVVKLDVATKNSGNVPTSVNFELILKKGDEVIAHIPGIVSEFDINEQKNVRLYWDTNIVDEGKYDIYVLAKTIPKGTEKTTTTEKYATVIVGEDKPLYLLIGGVLLIIVIIIVLFIKHRGNV